MRISGIQVDRFGIWNGVNFDGLSEGVNVFYGPNEAGKTTLMQFIRMVLYGFGSNRAQRYLKSVGHGMLSVGNRVGGSLSIASHDDEYHVRRYASQTDPMNDLRGELRVTSRDGNRQGEHRLAAILAGIDEQIFNNVYAVGLREMQYLGTLNDTQASRYLYNLSTGTDRVSLVDVMRQLQATRSSLIGGKDESALLETMTERRERHVAEVGQFANNVDQWALMRSELQAVDDEVARIESGRKNQARRSHILEVASRVEPLWEQRRKIELKLEAMGSAPNVTAQTRSQLDELSRQIESRQNRLDELQQQKLALQPEVGADKFDEEAFVRNALRIEALLGERSAVTSLDDQLTHLKSRLDETEFEIQGELERLGLASGSESEVKFDDDVLAVLREPARQVERDREMLEKAKQDARRLKEQHEHLTSELRDTLGRDPDFALQGDALNQTGEIARHLRRRMSLESKLQQLSERLEEVGERRKAIYRSQLLPWEVVRALGALFALGAALLLCAVFGHWLGIQVTTRKGLAIMGTIAAATAALLKVMLDGSSRDDLLGLQEQARTLEKQFEQAQSEADNLERLIPGRRTGPITLGEAHEQLVRIESLMPQDSRRRALLDSSKKYEEAAIEIANRLKRSRDNWARTLESLNLPSTLTPKQIQEMVGESAQLARLNREAISLRDQIAGTQRELDVFGERAADLLVDVGMRSSGMKVVEMLGQLSSGMQVHDQKRQLSDQRIENKRRLRERESDLQRELRQFESQRRAIVASHGAVDDEDLERLLKQREDWEKFTEKRESLSREIQAMLGEKKDERAITAELFREGNQPLGDRAAKLDSERQRADARLKELLTRRGELVQKSRALAEDRSLTDALLNVGIADAQIDKGVEQAKIVGVMTNLLRDVYKRYEKDRQPETLKEASKHLRRMTNGKYTRIWTPLDQDLLYVDDPHRMSIPVDQLSRGTREQLFLALRLALVAGYGRRGVRLPVVLDDVLVNFDVERTRAAAEVLVEFALAGHQVLIFSCHQHVMEIFGAHGVDVRTLPGHDLPVPRRPEVEPQSASGSEEVLFEPPQTARPRSRPRPAPPRELTEFAIGYDDGESDALFGHEEHDSHFVYEHAELRHPQRFEAEEVGDDWAREVEDEWQNPTVDEWDDSRTEPSEYEHDEEEAPAQRVYPEISDWQEPNVSDPRTPSAESADLQVDALSLEESPPTKRDAPVEVGLEPFRDSVDGPEVSDQLISVDAPKIDIRRTDIPEAPEIVEQYFEVEEERSAESPSDSQTPTDEQALPDEDVSYAYFDSDDESASREDSAVSSGAKEKVALGAAASELDPFAPDEVVDLTASIVTTDVEDTELPTGTADEYEYVEEDVVGESLVETDGEISGSESKAAEDEDEGEEGEESGDEYEYVEEDADPEAALTEEDVEYEYVEVDDDEDEGEESGDDDEDVEYEYVDAEDDSDAGDDVEYEYIDEEEGEEGDDEEDDEEDDVEYEYED